MDARASSCGLILLCCSLTLRLLQECCTITYRHLFAYALLVLAANEDQKNKAERDAVAA
jgi:hypothetical protein